MFSTKEIEAQLEENKKEKTYNEMVRCWAIIPVPQKIYDRIQKFMEK